MRLAWDEFGIDTILLTVIDRIDSGKENSANVITDFNVAIHKLSEYLKATYSDYYDIPLLITSTENNNIEKAEKNPLEANVTNSFVEYCKKMKIQYSYKPVLAKCIVHYAVSKKAITIDEILDFYEKYYLERFLKNMVREQSNSIFSKLNYSKLSARDLLLRMPIAIFEKQYFVSVDKHNGIINFPSNVVDEIRANVDEINITCDNILREYYENIKSDIRYKIYEHTNPYGNKKRGITRSECRERHGIHDRCIFIESEISIETARDIIQNSDADIKIVDYYGNPLHLLLFDANYNLINAFDSVLEAACLLGLKPSYIKACCRGEENHPRYIWKYGEEYLLNFEKR